MRLTVGGGVIERVLDDAEALLEGYRTDDGIRYLDYEPSTDPDRLMPEDLAVTILINSRVAGRAFKSVQDHGAGLVLPSLPDVPLEESSPTDRDAVADLVAGLEPRCLSRRHTDMGRGIGGTMRIGLASVAVLAALLPISPALAHRCDNCFEPKSGPPGTVVTAPRSYRVTWNQDHHYTHRNLYRPNAPTLELFSASTPRRRVTIVIPDVPPGRYALSAYDGSEGGGHYVYTAFRVTQSSSILPSTGPAVAWTMAIGIIGAFIGGHLIYLGRTRDSRQASA